MASTSMVSVQAFVLPPSKGKCFGSAYFRYIRSLNSCDGNKSPSIDAQGVRHKQAVSEKGHSYQGEFVAQGVIVARAGVSLGGKVWVG